MTHFKSRRLLFVQLSSKHINAVGSINLGIEIITDYLKDNNLKYDLLHYDDEIININAYDTILFNIIHISHSVNLLYFLRKHNILPAHAKKISSKYLLLGGSGLSNVNLFYGIVDYIHFGFFNKVSKDIVNNPILLSDYDFLKFNSLHSFKHTFINKSFQYSKLHDKPIFFNGRAYIELSRGCPFKCNFCQYSWMIKKYIEQDIEDIKTMIIACILLGYKRINFFSANFTAYSHINELLDFCELMDISIQNSDISINSLSTELIKKLSKFNLTRLSIGIESFNENTRYLCNKRFSNKFLFNILSDLFKYFNSFHFYFIIGLPGEENNMFINRFIRIIELLHKRAPIQNKKIDISFTNFQPSPYTPFSKFNLISFKEKKDFILYYLRCLQNTFMLSNSKYIRFTENIIKDNYHQQFNFSHKKENYYILMFLHHFKDENFDLLDYIYPQHYIRSFNPIIYRKLSQLTSFQHFIK